LRSGNAYAVGLNEGRHEVIDQRLVGWIEAIDRLSKLAKNGISDLGNFEYFGHATLQNDSNPKA
jgi:hypothetical protein